MQITLEYTYVEKFFYILIYYEILSRITEVIIITDFEMFNKYGKADAL